MAFFAVVFRSDFPPGAHWRNDAPADDPDRRQEWRAGDLYSTGTVVGDLPSHLEAIEVVPPEPGQVWDRDRRAFV